MEQKIYDILNELGVPFGVLGRQYIVRAVAIIFQNGRMAMTKELYPQLAAEFETTSARAERAIRHAIERVFDSGNVAAIGKYFGANVDYRKGKLTNTDFIYGLAEYLRFHS